MLLWGTVTTFETAYTQDTDLFYAENSYAMFRSNPTTRSKIIVRI